MMQVLHILVPFWARHDRSNETRLTAHSSPCSNFGLGKMAYRPTIQSCKVYLLQEIQIFVVVIMVVVVVMVVAAVAVVVVALQHSSSNLGQIMDPAKF